jgi:hypothetical protein
VRRDRRDHSFDVIVHLEEVDLRLVTINAEAAGRAYGLRGFAGGNQRFGRYATIVQAVAAHLALLDKDHPGAHLHGAGGHCEATRTCADDAQIGPNEIGHVLRPLIS